MTKYLNFFEFESGYTEAVGADELFYPNVSYTEDDDTVHWNLEQPVKPVQTPMLRMSFSTSTPGEEVKLRQDYVHGITAMEIDGTPLDIGSGGTYSIAEPGSHTAVYQFASPEIPLNAFSSDSIPNAFSAFTSAEITSAVTSIANNAFRRCTALSSVTIPNSVTTIGNESFSNCSGLTRVTIPNSVTSIGDGAFEESGLRYINIKDTVTWLGGFGAFKGCAQMVSAAIGSGITSIPSLVFADCTSLQSVALPGNLRQIGQGALSGCSSLHDIKIPSGVTTIGKEAFSRCSGLTVICFNSETPPTLGADALLNTNDCPISVSAASVEVYKQAWPGYATRIKARHRISASVNDSSLGKVNLWDKTAASEGERVYFDVEVFDSETKGVTSLTITDGNGDNVQVTNEGYNRYWFTMPDSEVTIFATIGEKQKYNITASLNDSSLGNVDLSQETASEGDFVEFEVNVNDPDANQVSSVTVTDRNGDEVEYTDDGDEYYHHYTFIMPASDITINVVIGEKIPEGQYKISKVINDSSLGNVSVQKTASEGDRVEFDVEVFDPDANQVSSVTVTDGNGDEVECDGDFHYYTNIFTMPASDVTINVTVEPKQ